MTAAPPISIGLPIRNGERYLAQTLADLQAQTLPDFEVVVCDNASTDATEEIVRAAAATDPRIRYVRHDRDLGALPNTNRAFERSRGDLFVLAAHDDRRSPDFLAVLQASLQAHPNAVVAYGDQTLIGADGRPFAFDRRRRLYVGPEGVEYLYDAALQRALPSDPVARYEAVLHTNDTGAPIHGMFRREILERVGPHHIYGSDRLILAHAALLGTFAYVPAPVFAYRIHGESTLHLTRRQRLARETGGATRGGPLDAVRTLQAFLAAVADAGLPPAQRARAVAATLRYAVHADRLRRLVTPGPDNLFGWTGRSTSETEGVEPWKWAGYGDYALSRWHWLFDGHAKTVETEGSLESRPA